jgi:hypothetical protein
MTRSMAGYREEAHGIFSVPLCEPDLCNAIVARIRRLSWTVAQVQLEKVGGGHGTFTRTRTRSASLLNSPRAKDLCQEFDVRIDEVVKPIIKRIWRVSLDQLSGTQIIRYRKGGRYIAHTDAGRDLAERYFSVVCYLNDNFDGGHTFFPGLAYSAEPETGKAIVFPSRYVHCAEPVTSGEKFVVISWVCGPIPVSWI